MILTVVAVGALLLAYVALVAAWLALRTLGRLRRAAALPARGSGDEGGAARQAAVTDELAARLDRLQADLDGTRRGAAARLRTGERDVADALETLRADVATSLRRVALVRYDAFGDHGGRLSFSLALLDDAGDGVTLTSIAGRSEARLYAKGVQGGTGERDLSPEEEQAVRAALREVRPGGVREAS